MRKVITTIFLCVSLLFSGYAQQLPAPRLVIRADDMGATHAINQAILYCGKNGIETSIELMVTLPWLPEAVKMLKENPGLDVGIHLDLNSEWDLYKPRPLTQCMSLIDANGYFFPYVKPDPKFPGQAIMEHDWKMEDIEKELRAQIELGIKLVPWVSHISGHMGVTDFDKRVVVLASKLAADYHLPDINTNPLGDYNIIEIAYDGPHKTFEEKVTSFIKMLESLEPGKTYMFVDHPAYDTEEMHPISYKGVANVALQRQGVTDLLCSDKIKKVIKERGIQLVNFKEVTK